MNIITGQRPDLTPAQLVSGIPILAELLHSFGIYDLSVAQQSSLAHAATWAMALVAGDTILWVGRGVALSRVQAAGVAAGAGATPPLPAPPTAPPPPTAPAPPTAPGPPPAPAPPQA